MHPYRASALPRIPRDRRWVGRAFLLGTGTLIGVAATLAARVVSEPSAAGRTVDELLTGPEATERRQVMLRGTLVPGSFVRVPNMPCEVSFSLEHNGFRVPVHNASWNAPEQCLPGLGPTSGNVTIHAVGRLLPSGFEAVAMIDVDRARCDYGSERRATDAAVQ